VLATKLPCELSIPPVMDVLLRSWHALLPESVDSSLDLSEEQRCDVLRAAVGIFC